MAEIGLPRALFSVGSDPVRLEAAGRIRQERIGLRFIDGSGGSQTDFERK